MADTLVSIVLQQLNSIIHLRNELELTLAFGVKEELNKLSTVLKIIQAVLEDAEEKQMRDKDVKVWLQEIKDAAYELDDILDDWCTAILKSKIEEEKKKKKKKKKVSTYLSPCICFNHVCSDHDTTHKIKEIRKRLDSIANDKGKYQLVEKRSRVMEETENLKTTSMTHVSEIYGRDTDKNIIISKLLSESSQQGMGLHVISIVGMGGLGKTTLAQLVFNDKKLINHFDKRVWVCVPKPFNEIKIAKDIIEAIGESSPGSLAWESLQQHLYNSVKGRRFLLVLDDVWIEDHIKWAALKYSLDYGALGSRILVTTCDKKVALTMGAINPYHLQPLSNGQCFSLFSHLAFSGREEKEWKQFEEIGKEIAKKCQGVPLAAKVLGCLMGLKSTKQDWLDILESETWKYQESVLPALLLSYYDLPRPLKCCFAFCAIFPKDHWIDKDKLIKLWMSQGFLGMVGRKELEVIGAQCFDNLVIRSFFQDLRKDKDGHIYSCKMHDSFHDLAQYISEKECSIVEMRNNGNGELYYNKNFRHLSLISGEEVMNSIPLSLHSFKILHTLKIFGEISVITLPPILFGYLTCLRALDLSKTKLTELPTDVGKLIHLRYLDLSMTDIKELPETISEVCHLQTLKLDNCEYLSKLPEGIGKLSNLRHLEIENTVRLNYLPQEIGRLTSLQTLSRFFASEGCKIGELKNLNLLQGRLEITRLNRVANKSESCEAGLKNKKDIHSLVLEFSDDILGENEVEGMEGVLQGLEPHPKLEKLSIYEYPAFKLPSWMNDESVLSNLRSLSLSCCWKLRHLPATLWKLPFLEVLEIDRLPNWEEWTIGVEDGVVISTTILPCLRVLIISSCPKLKTLPALGKLASLESIRIEGLHGLTCLGCEIYGIYGDGGDMKGSVFPKLKELTFSFMSNLEEWELGVDAKDIKIMPCLRMLKFYKCPKLKVVPATGILVSLEQLSVCFTSTIKYMGDELYEGGEDDGYLFPELESIEFGGMENWEECEIRRAIVKHRQIMPSLTSLVLWHCPMLVAPPHHLLVPHISPPLRKLVIGDCPLLGWMQPPLQSPAPLPPLLYVFLPFLEELELIHNAGSLSRSLLSPDNSKICFPNLKSLTLTGSPHTSLPQGIGQATMLQRLTIWSCNQMTHISKEIQHLAMLQELRILYCEILGSRCQEGAADWGKISHIPSIVIDGVFVERQLR